MRGRIKFFRPEKGFGFIVGEGKSGDTYFNRNGIEGAYKPNSNDVVEYELREGSSRPEAIRIRPAETVQFEPSLNTIGTLHFIEDGQGEVVADLSLVSLDARTSLTLQLEHICDFESAANFLRGLAFSLLHAGQYGRADSRATAASHKYASLRQYGRYKKSLSSCVEVRIRCLTELSPDEVKQDISSLHLAAQDICEKAFSQLGPIPRDLRLKCNQLVIGAAEKWRLGLIGDTDKVRELITRNYPFLWKLPTGPGSEYRQIREEWHHLAEMHCTDLAAEMAFSPSEELGLRLGERVDDFRAARNDRFCMVPSDLRDILCNVATKASSDSIQRVDKILVPREPQRVFWSKKKQSSQLFAQAKTQVVHKNYLGAFHTLERILPNEMTTAAIWEWLAYVELCLDRPQLASSHLDTAKTYASADESARWNLACAWYRVGEIENSLSELLECSATNAQQASLGLALKLADSGRALKSLGTSDNLELLLLGYVTARDQNDLTRAKQFLDNIIVKFHALQDPFPPLPLEEELDREDVQTTLAYFFKYDLLDDGINHFKFRLDANQRPTFALLRALGQLFDRKGDQQGALNCIGEECGITLSSPKAPVGVKRECLEHALDFCLRRKATLDGKNLLTKYGEILDKVQVKEYSRKLEAGTNASAQAPGRAVFQPKLPDTTVNAETLTAQNDAAERLRHGNQRLAELNRKHGRLNTIFKVRDSKSELDEYCDHMQAVYGERLTVAWRVMRAVIQELSAAADAPDESGMRDAVIRARGFLQELERELQEKLLKSERQELVVVDRLKACLGEAQVRIGQFKAPDLTLLDQSFPGDRSETTLFLRIKNDGATPLNQISVTADSERGTVQIVPSQFLTIESLQPGESRVAPLRVRRAGEGDEDTLYFSSKYVAGDMSHISPAAKLLLRVRPFRPIALDRYIVGQSVPVTRPENFHGRETELTSLLELIEAARGGAQGVIYLDGIKQVGKSSILNFVTSKLGEWVSPVRISMIGCDFPSSADVLRTLAQQICRQCLAQTQSVEDSALIGSPEDYERRPIQEFRNCLSRVRDRAPRRTLVLIIDEVQELIRAISESDKLGKGPTPQVLNAWQAEVEEGGLILVLTGSLRVSKVHKYLSHSFFRRINRVRVGFLSRGATARALQVPVESCGVTYSDEAIERAWKLTSGYASIVQRCGLECLHRLNADGRYVIAPSDVDEVALSLLSDANLFQWWWDPAFMGEREALVVKTFLQLQDAQTSNGIEGEHLRKEVRELGSDVNLVLSNLADQEILEFTNGKYRIKGELLEEWLSRKFRGDEPSDNDVLNYCVLAIDHENFFIGMKEVLEQRRGKRRVDGRQLENAIRNLVNRVSQYGNLVLPFSVAVWGKGEFLPHQLSYKNVDQRFDVPFPARYRPQASDDEIRRAICEKVESTLLPNRAHGTVILVSGDHGFAEMVDRLKKQGRRVIVWYWNTRGFSEDLKRSATKIEYLDEIVGLDGTLDQTA